MAMSRLVSLFGTVLPGLTARYLVKRYELEAAQRLYEAARPDGFRPMRGSGASGDGLMEKAGPRLREMSRYLDENHDLVVGIFEDIVNNVVGAGVQVQPMARTRDGKLHERFNDQLRDAWEIWAQSPETTGDLGFEAMERATLRSMLRDGEMFVHTLPQSVARSFRYRTPVPFVVELLEADFVPFDYSDAAQNVLQGVQCNEWGAPLNYMVFKHHPGDPLRITTLRDDLKTVPAEDMIHMKFTRRLRQRRGVPILHAVINRLRDIKDYEESERIAAKVAADLTAFIKRTAEYQGAVNLNDAGNRVLQMQAGSIFELLPGEDVGTIQSNRPNAKLVDFREAMMRAVAAGTGTRFSAIARNYNGTYSAQRQELVEGAIAYRAHFAYLARRLYRPLYERFVAAAMQTNLVRAFPDLDQASMSRVDFRAPALPWIDPNKEAQAWKALIESKLESRQEIMRQRGRDPAKVWEELEEEGNSGLFSSAVEDGVLEFGMPSEEEEEAA